MSSYDLSFLPDGVVAMTTTFSWARTWVAWYFREPSGGLRVSLRESFRSGRRTIASEEQKGLLKA